jgi:hypothetical protein
MIWIHGCQAIKDDIHIPEQVYTNNHKTTILLIKVWNLELGTYYLKTIIYKTFMLSLQVLLLRYKNLENNSTDIRNTSFQISI